MNTLHRTCRFVIPVCFSILLIGKPFIIPAQTPDTATAFQQQFDAFKFSINQEFNTFRQHNDSVFLQFLTQSWKEFDAVQHKMPSPPKPVNHPTYEAPVTPLVPKPDSALPETPDSIEQPGPEWQKLPEEVSPIPATTDTVPEKASMSIAAPLDKIEYFGTNFSVPASIPGLPVLTAISKQGVIDYFAAASGSALLNSVAITLKKEAAICKLNDWGLANLLMKAGQKMYPRSNDQVMFAWFGMLRSGFNVKVGYDKQNVYLLLPSNEMLYETSYTINGKQYYLLNFGTGQAAPEHLSIHEGNYPQSIAGLSFLITQTPELARLIAKRKLVFGRSLDLIINKNLIDFYGSYPRCELKVFFKAPLSPNSISQLDAYFIPVLEGKNDDGRVAFLLKFVQEAIPYQTDSQQFGHEKYLFADETLYYPAADCEDRAVFLAKLINRYTNCKAIGLSYPTHVSLAVNLSACPNGKYISYNNLRYYHCDPTYLGAPCGVPMPEYENLAPKIIDFAP